MSKEMRYKTGKKSFNISQNLPPQYIIYYYKLLCTSVWIRLYFEKIFKLTSHFPLAESMIHLFALPAYCLFPTTINRIEVSSQRDHKVSGRRADRGK